MNAYSTLRTLLAGSGILLATAVHAQSAGGNNASDAAAVATLAGMEYFIDADPGYGRATPIARAEAGEHTYQISAVGLAMGVHVLHLRALDGNGNWSPVWCRPFYVCPVPAGMAQMEYFVDTDPGYGRATPIARAETGEQTCLIPTDGLAMGAHVLHLRALDGNGNWSSVWCRPFYVYPVKQGVTRMEYFFDDTDPGEGKATAVSLPEGSIDEITFDADMAGLSAGNHQFNLRVADGDGRWGIVSSEPFTVIAADGIARVEWDMPLDCSLKNGICTVKADSHGDCRIQVYGMDGRLLAQTGWPAGMATVSLDIHGRTPVIVKVSDKKTGRHVTRKLSE